MTRHARTGIVDLFGGLHEHDHDAQA
jgi:hypothetical protein